MNMKVDSQRRRSLEALFQGYGRNSKCSVLLKGSWYLLESKMEPIGVKDDLRAGDRNVQNSQKIPHTGDTNSLDRCG